MTTPYCFLRVSVRLPDGKVQDYVVDGQTTVRDFAASVLGVEVSDKDATPQPFLGSIQILEIVTIPGGVTPIPFNAHSIWRNDE